jgi:hypothetical protein
MNEEDKWKEKHNDRNPDARHGFVAVRWHDAASRFTNQAEAVDAARRNSAAAHRSTETCALQYLPQINGNLKQWAGCEPRPFF